MLHWISTFTAWQANVTVALTLSLLALGTKFYNRLILHACALMTVPFLCTVHKLNICGALHLLPPIRRGGMCQRTGILQILSFMFLLFLYLKKVKWSRYRSGMAQRVGIALLFHDRGTRRGWVVSSTPRPHFIPGKDPVPILQEAGWAPGPVWTGRKSRSHRDSTPDHPALSQSLYRLSYPVHIIPLLGSNIHCILSGWLWRGSPLYSTFSL